MYVITVATQKGGSGKTTLAGHLAVAAAEAGAGPVAIMDEDPQSSATTWWQARKAEDIQLVKRDASIGLKEQIATVKRAGTKILVIDTPPALDVDALLAVAHLVIVPVRPSPHDLRAIGSTVSSIEEARKPFVFVITQAKSQARLTAQAAAILSQHGKVAPAIIADRVDYAAAMTDGRTVLEIDPNGRASKEIRELWLYVMTQLRKTTT